MADYCCVSAMSIVITRSAILPYSQSQFERILAAVLRQQYIAINKIIIVEIAGQNKKLHLETVSEKPKTAQSETTIVWMRVRSPDYSSLLQLAVAEAEGDYLLLLNAESAPVYLQNTAACAFAMAFTRDGQTAMVYSDYTIASNGQKSERHLLDYHPGRVRDNLDLGYVYAFSLSALATIDWSDGYRYATLYDLRLKLSLAHQIKHISNRFAGALYWVEKQPGVHNVFDYLQASADCQLEMEKALTGHLRRIDAYLPPRHLFPLTTPVAIKSAPDEIAVTIIIPVYQRPEFISFAIDSALQQTCRDQLEIIVVVNGGEQDPTIEVVQRYLPGGAAYNSEAPPVRMLVLDLNNIGLCLNLGLRMARGKYYLQLDSDDRLKPFAVERILQVFATDPSIAMVIGSYEVWEKQPDGSVTRRDDIPVVKHEEWSETNGRNNLLRINGAGAPRAYAIEAVARCGWFGINDDPYARNYGEDYDMVLRLSEHYHIERIWEPVYEVVRHHGGTDHAIDQQTIDRNDNAKDMMRWQAIRRRQQLNRTYPGENNE